MASLVQPFPIFAATDNAFVTTNFDHTRDSNEDISYFDQFNSSYNVFAFNHSDSSQPWSSVQQRQQQQQMQEQNAVLDPLPSIKTTIGSLDDLLPREPVVPPSHSASDGLDIDEFFTSISEEALYGKQQQMLPTLDTQILFNNVSAPQRHGQTAPSTSGRSPESEPLAETTANTITATKRRGSESTANARKGALASSSKASAVAKLGPDSANDEEPQMKERKAKRARRLECNRRAACTWRQRTKQRSKDLEERQRTLGHDNEVLRQKLQKLRNEHHHLRQQVVAHSTCESSGASEYILRASKSL